MKLAIFDLDGTLVDAYKAVQISFNVALEALGYPSLDLQMIRKNVGWGERILISRFVKEEDIDEVIFLYQQHHEDALKLGVQVLPYAKELLTFLKKSGITLAIASNRSERFTRIILEHKQLLPYFDYLLCGDKVKNPKPAPDMLNKICDKFHCTSQEAVYIGDMVVDVQAGRRASIKTIAVTTGSSTSEEILAENPFACVASLDDVKNFLIKKLKFHQ